jgi:Ca2+/Na+ antiporter
LSFAYLSTCLSAIQLERTHERSSSKLRVEIIILALGIIFSLVLMSQVSLQQIIVSLLLLALGVPVYIFFSPKRELHELKHTFLSQEEILRRTYDQGERFLAYPIRRIKWLIYRTKRIERAWIV